MQAYNQHLTGGGQLSYAGEVDGYKRQDMYATFAKEAKEEGFDKIAYLFEAVGKIEKEHEARYLALLKNVKEGLVFSKDGLLYTSRCV